MSLMILFVQQKIEGTKSLHNNGSDECNSAQLLASGQT
jgi:hypothetical protein